MIVEQQRLKYTTNTTNFKEFNGPSIKTTFPGYNGSVELSLERLLLAAQNVLKTGGQELFYKKHAFNLVASFLVSLVSREKDQRAVVEFFTLYKPVQSPSFNQQMTKAKLEDEHRKMVEVAISSLFYACGVKELREYALPLLDSLVAHFTLLSLAFYNRQDEPRLIALLQSNVFTQYSGASPTAGLAPLQQLDHFVLVDAMYSVLCHDDMEFWSIAQRVLALLVEVSEIVCGGAHLAEPRHMFRENLANLALFDYLAEKAAYLCYERSWFAKRAG